MAVDKLVDSTQLNADLTNVANAIRAKGGTSASLAFPDGFVDAIGDIETGGGVTVSPLSVTANGTYTAPSGEAYSPVTVNVPTGGGGTSNVVTGTFTGTTTGAAMDVTLNYSGSGYPIAVMVYPEEGTYHSGGAFYSLVQRYAVQLYAASKIDPSIAPTYTENTQANQFTLILSYKNNATAATSYTRTSSTYAGIAINQDAGESNTSIVRIRSSKKMSVYIPTGGVDYGFAANIPYRYWVIYSK